MTTEAMQAWMTGALAQVTWPQLVIIWLLWTIRRELMRGRG